MLVMDVNVCFETGKEFTTIAYYTHLIPTVIALIITIFVLIRTRFSPLARVFAYFVFALCVWFVGDLIAWVSNDSDLIAAVWAPLDYINVVFYLLGMYFFLFFFETEKIKLFQKVILLGLSVPAWWLTVSNQAMLAFYQPDCEAINNELLTVYKLGVELFVIISIALYSLYALLKQAMSSRRRQIVIVAVALLLFFTVFSVTEYLSSHSGLYEINLYSLFVLPLFLIIIIYTITDLGIFKIHLIGSQLLAYTLIVLIGSQFFFLEDTTDKMLTIVTFLLSVGFGILLVRSGLKEEEARKNVEKLAIDLEKANSSLKELDRQKDELISIVSHQLATPVTSVKWYIEMLLEGDAGALNEEQKKQLSTMQEVTEDLVDLVGMILDVSRIQLGRMKVDLAPLDLGAFFAEVLAVIEPRAQVKKQQFVKTIPASLPTASLDKRLMRMTLENLLSNAVKYTPEGGKVELTVTATGRLLRYEVRDTGCGIPREEQEKIFGKLYRATNVRNTEGNGLGLFAAKGAAEAHGGNVWFESVAGKGTTFYVEVPIGEKKESGK